jgi:hypothetical protein
LDIVHAATALLELYTVDTTLPASSGSTTATGENTATPANPLYFTVDTKQSTLTFHEAYSLLGTRNDELIKKGISVALEIQRVSHSC